MQCTNQPPDTDLYRYMHCIVLYLLFCVRRHFVGRHHQHPILVFYTNTQTNQRRTLLFVSLPVLSLSILCQAQDRSKVFGPLVYICSGSIQIILSASAGTINSPGTNFAWFIPRQVRHRTDPAAPYCTPGILKHRCVCLFGSQASRPPSSSRSKM